MKKKILLIAAVAVMIPCLFTSCITSMIINGVSASKAASDFKEDVVNNYAEYNPTNAAIVYAYGIYDLRMVQQNPKIGYKIYESNDNSKSISTYAVLPPVPVNSELSILGYRYTGYRTIYIVSGSIQGVDFTVTKPGLFYTGIRDEKNAFELAATKTLLTLYKGTEWEEIINARIEELSNGKKE